MCLAAHILVRLPITCAVKQPAKLAAKQQPYQLPSCLLVYQHACLLATNLSQPGSNPYLAIMSACFTTCLPRSQHASQSARFFYLPQHAVEQLMLEPLHGDREVDHRQLRKNLRREVRIAQL